MEELIAESDRVLVRAVRAGDVAAVVALIRDVLAEFDLTFGDGCDTDTQLLDLPNSYLVNGGQFWIATGDGGALIGTCGVFPVAPATFELRKMYLAKAARGLGVGRRLLAVSIEFARAHGATMLVLDSTEQMTRARAFYEANGFVRDDAQVRGERCTRGYRLDLAGQIQTQRPGS